MGGVRVRGLNLGDLRSHDGVLSVDIWYPRNGNNGRTADQPVAVEVGLIDVRAADSIRIHYDFERDGYVIRQASKFEWAADDEVCDPGWQEVAFIQAWGREP